jgi:uncharacterized protein
MERAEVDGIPVGWVRPAGRPVGAALWLSHLGGSVDQTEPMLGRLAERGRLAVSFDPPGHGRRGSGDPWALAGQVLGSFRRLMWPLAGTTTLESLRVLDWAEATFGTPDTWVAGGVSMGGDISVALAGIDERIARVAALVATPDWTRPGMRVLNDPDTVLDQGSADAYAQWFYDRLDPMTHLDRYRRDVAISFQCGGEDSHVPADGALRFRAALGDRVRVDIHPGVSHVDGTQPFYDYALDWLTNQRP